MSKIKAKLGKIEFVALDISAQLKLISDLLVLVACNINAQSYATSMSKIKAKLGKIEFVAVDILARLKLISNLLVLVACNFNAQSCANSSHHSNVNSGIYLLGIKKRTKTQCSIDRRARIKKGPSIVLS